MGSGKGLNKRVKNTSVILDEFAIEDSESINNFYKKWGKVELLDLIADKNWIKFLRDNNLYDQFTLREYYLGANTSSIEDTNEEIQYMLSQYITDALTVSKGMNEEVMNDFREKVYSQGIEIKIDRYRAGASPYDIIRVFVGGKQVKIIKWELKKNSGFDMKYLLNKVGDYHMNSNPLFLLTECVVDCLTKHKEPYSIMVYGNDNSPRNHNSIKELKISSTDKGELASPKTGSVNGKTFVITGKLSKPRQEISGDIMRNGGMVKPTLSRNVDYLVMGAKTGSKLQKAQTLGIPVITEQELIQMY